MIKYDETKAQECALLPDHKGPRVNVPGDHAQCGYCGCQVFGWLPSKAVPDWGDFGVGSLSPGPRDVLLVVSVDGGP